MVGSTDLKGAGVHCAFDMLVDPETLVPNPRNPNRHPDEQIRLLSKVITQQGWRCPITVSNRSGFVVRGHGRLQAALVAGLSEVPVDYQDYANEAAEWADLIADNRIAELAEMDMPSLKDLLDELGGLEIDMELTGFDDKALDNLMNQLEIELDHSEPKSSVTENECPRCGYSW
jgi:ParB-like chromosome segregation protein Spo0J